MNTVESDITMADNKCIHILDNKCNKVSVTCYGGFCKSHKDEFLLKDGYINIETFTNEIKDYRLTDLQKYCNTKISKSPSKFKKSDYFNKLCEYQKRHTYLSGNIDSVHKLQASVRLWYIKHTMDLRGTAFINRSICKNDEDFYTYEPIQDIENKYFFSYKDNQDNYWGFDIRSLNKLINMNYGNPYTTETFTTVTKSKVNDLIMYLEKHNVIVHIDNTVVADRKTMVKQKFVDIFSQMEYVGYSCDVSWILDLNNSKLKVLYRELEDIWNYRANLTETLKRSIVPTDGKLCSMGVHDYNRCNSRVELLEILATVLLKICNTPEPSNMNLGFMYFIISLSFVSRECFMIHNWVQSVF
jgi:hypothetical protein